MMILTNKKYADLMETLARIERKLDVKKPAIEKPRGGAALNGAHKNLSLTQAVAEIMKDGVMRSVGQATYMVKTSGLCRHSVNRHSVNALLSRMFIQGQLVRTELGHYQDKR